MRALHSWLGNSHFNHIRCRFAWCSPGSADHYGFQGLKESRIGNAGSIGVENGGLTLSAQSGDRECHRNAMIIMRIDLCSTERLASRYT